eukprot:7382848-Prymnesium_polylepis.1
MRKFMFIAVRQLRVDILIQSFLALCSVAAIAFLEFYFHPFRSKLYDYLEEFTSLTEFMLLLLGLMLAADPGQRSWISPIAWAFVLTSFVGIIVSLMIDMAQHWHTYKYKALREKLDLVLSPSVFNLEFSHHLVIKYVTEAGKEQLDDFRRMEKALITYVISKQSKAGKNEMTKWSRLAENQPKLVNWLASGRFGSELKEKGPNPAKSYLNAATAANEASREELFPFCIFAKQASGGMLAWMSDEATMEELEMVHRVLSHMAEFNRKQEAVYTTTKGRMALWLEHSYYDKSAQKNNATWVERSKQA